MAEGGGGGGGGGGSACEEPDGKTQQLRHGATAYDLGPCLGRGGFGVCFKATERRYPGHQSVGNSSAQPVLERTVALKKVCMKQVRQASKEPHLWYEVGLHSQLRHRNIVELFSTFVFEDSVYFVLEYCSNRSLADIVQRTDSMPLDLGAYYFQQIIEGVQHLHDNSILHRDLKLSNILVSSDDTVKITDFGLACSFTRAYLERHIACGTPNYISPEALLRQGHTAKSDIWSCGVILYAMFAGLPPFQTHSMTAIYTNIVNCHYEFSTKHHKDEHLRDLIASVLQLDPSQRPELHQIASHQFCQYSTAYKALLTKENHRSTSCSSLSRSRSLRSLSKSLSNLLSRQSRSDLRKSTEKLFNKHMAVPLSKSLTVVDLKSIRTGHLIEHFRCTNSWNKKATEFSGTWLTWWRDETSTRGLYYQLSSGLNCVLYNDQMGCMQSVRTGRFYFLNLKAQRQIFHESPADCVDRFYQPMARDLGEAFKNVEQSNKLQEQLSWVSQGHSSAPLNYLMSWRSYANGYYHVFHMRDHSVQVNFAEWFILRICGQLCYFYQPTARGFVVETADFQAWCLQDVNAELVEVLCSLFL